MTETTLTQIEMELARAALEADALRLAALVVFVAIGGLIVLVLAALRRDARESVARAQRRDIEAHTRDRLLEIYDRLVVAIDKQTTALEIIEERAHRDNAVWLSGVAALSSTITEENDSLRGSLTKLEALIQEAAQAAAHDPDALSAEIERVIGAVRQAEQRIITALAQNHPQGWN